MRKKEGKKGRTIKSHFYGMFSLEGYNYLPGVAGRGKAGHLPVPCSRHLSRSYRVCITRQGSRDTPCSQQQRCPEGQGFAPGCAVPETPVRALPPPKSPHDTLHTARISPHFTDSPIYSLLYLLC